MIPQIAPQIFREMGRAFRRAKGVFACEDTLVRDWARVRRAKWAFVCEETFWRGTGRVFAGRNGPSRAKTHFGAGLGACSRGAMGLRVRRRILARDWARVRKAQWAFACEDAFWRGTGRVFAGRNGPSRAKTHFGAGLGVCSRGEVGLRVFRGESVSSYAETLLGAGLARVRRGIWVFVLRR